MPSREGEDEPLSREISVSVSTSILIEETPAPWFFFSSREKAERCTVTRDDHSCRYMSVFPKISPYTTYSDGQWLPEQLFDYVAAEGFDVVAVTDHDTLAHLDAVQEQAATHGVTALAGVEVTSRWRGRIAHVLCYATPRFQPGPLSQLVDETRLKQLENTQQVHAELEHRGYRFPRRDQILSAQQGQLLRPIDNARLLLDHGYANELVEALDLIAAAGYVIVAAPINSTIEAAHQSAAVALLAHPGRGGDGGEIPRYEPKMVDQLLHDVALDGVEVYYPSHTESQTEAYAQLAREHGLLVGAGSDSHGPEGRLPIRYPAALCQELLVRTGTIVS